MDDSLTPLDAVTAEEAENVLTESPSEGKKSLDTLLESPPKTMVVPLPTSSQPAIVAAAALGIPISSNRESSNSSNNVTLVPVVGRRVVLHGLPTTTTVVTLQQQQNSQRGNGAQSAVLTLQQRGNGEQSAVVFSPQERQQVQQTANGGAEGGLLLQKRTTNGGGGGGNNKAFQLNLKAAEQLVGDNTRVNTAQSATRRVVIVPSSSTSSSGSAAIVSSTEADLAISSSNSNSNSVSSSNNGPPLNSSNNPSSSRTPPAVLTVTVGGSSANNLITEDNSTNNSRMFDPGCSYTTLNGRMTPPGYAVSNSYATLTPLQPLPPISTISSMQDKFQSYSPGSNSSNVTGSFVMQNNLPNISLGSPYNSYDKLAMSPPPYPTHTNGTMTQHSPSALSPHGSYSHNELHSKQEPLSPSSAAAAAAAAAAYYDPAQRPSPHDLSPPHSIDTNSPTGGNNAYNSSQAMTSTNNPSLNGGLTSPQTISPVPHHSPGGANHPLPSHSPPSPHQHPSSSTIITSLHNSVNAVQLHQNQVLHHVQQQQQQQQQPMMTKSQGNNNNNSNSSNAQSEGEEINTKELAQRISAELKRYSIPQAIFAQRVLCRSQGTLSDLLRNPKPWSKLKSGRETFRRMAKWLQEPEFQRMSALRLAGNGNIFYFLFFHFGKIFVI